MRQFYEQWCNIVNRPPMADDLQTTDDETLLPFNLYVLSTHSQSNFTSVGKRIKLS